MDILFIIKKIISSFIMPLPIGIILAILALIFLYKNSYKKTKIFLTLSILWISLFSYAPFSNMLLYPLENAYPKLKNVPLDIKYIVFLGGDQQNRGWEVLRVHNILPNSKIITSGYAGQGTIPEAIKTAKILENIGIQKNNIIIHPKPKDTKQEAMKIKEVLKDENFILVTSAYHMPRAMMIFKSVGLNPLAAPTDYLIKDSDKVISFPNTYQLKKSTRAWHEYIGILYFKLMHK